MNLKTENASPVMEIHTPKMGEVWWATIENHVGHQQGGHRPVLVVSNNISNRYAPIIDVLTITSSPQKLKKQHMPQHALIPAGTLEGLERPSIVLSENMWHLNKEQLESKIGVLPDDIMQEVAIAMFHQCPFLKLAVDADVSNEQTFLKILHSA
jgi:mRNA-degrading endonuclease toxin of MazEF toxin-antitoxin module